MTCQRCGTSEGVRHYDDLEDPGWFCGPCHALAKQMDLIEIVAGAERDSLEHVGWRTPNGALHTDGRHRKYHAGITCEPVYRLVTGQSENEGTGANPAHASVHIGPEATHD